MLCYELAFNLPLNKTFTYYLSKSFSAIGIGQIVLVEFKNKKNLACVVSKTIEPNISIDKIKPILEVFDFSISHDILQLIFFLHRYYQYPLGQTIFTVLPHYTIKNIKTPLSIKKKSIILNNESVLSVALNNQQAKTLCGIQSHIKANIRKPIILYGITGSGKTEIYIELIKTIIKEHKQVLVLLPEINLTPQMLQRFYSQLLGVKICVLNSSISNQERLYLYQEIKSSNIDVIIGTRLAIFCDFANLGLIIIDEEHDLSFKQNEGLRYHARDVAVYRAKQYNIPIILGSATPSLESLYNYKLKKYELVKLEVKALSIAPMPSIKLIDMNQQPPNTLFSDYAIKSIQQRLDKNELVLIYINRRGYAPIVSCYDCGYIFCCKNCSNNMVFHHITKQLKCHKCSYIIDIPSRCITCGSDYLKIVGDGTQKIEVELGNLFSSARVVRVDQDSIGKKNDWLDIYNKINNNEVDIIVGTQMLVKGHDFHNLTLVVGLNLDSGLYSSDFRASEIMFSQLMQISGRVGRGNKVGEVILHTRYPTHELFQFILKQDYSGFVKLLMRMRYQLHLPPYTYYALISANDYSMTKALSFLSNLYLKIKDEQIKNKLIILKPIEAIISKLKNKHRANMLIISNDRVILINLLSKLYHFMYNTKRTSSLSFSIDVDPYDLR
jgi:primosomal protein N' (replication factor Y)